MSSTLRTIIYDNKDVIDNVIDMDKFKQRIIIGCDNITRNYSCNFINRTIDKDSKFEVGDNNKFDDIDRCSTDNVYIGSKNNIGMVDICKNVSISHNNNIEDGVYIENDVEIMNNNKIRNKTYIGAGSYIGDSITLYSQVNIGKNVSICDNVTIGSKVTIEDGVTICDGAIIKAGATIKKGVTIGEYSKISTSKPIETNVDDYTSIHDDIIINDKSVKYNVMHGKFGTFPLCFINPKFYLNIFKFIMDMVKVLLVFLCTNGILLALASYIMLPLASILFLIMDWHNILLYSWIGWVVMSMIFFINYIKRG